MNENTGIIRAPRHPLRCRILLAMVALGLGFRSASAGPLEDIQSLQQVLNQQLAAGRYEQAEQAGLKMKQYAIDAFGRGSVLHAIALSDLTGVYAEWDRPDQTQQCADEAIAIMERVGQPNHPTLGVVYHNLGIAHSKRTKFAESIAAYQRALAIRTATSGADSPEVALTLENLAVAYEAQANYSTAESHYRRAIRLYIQHYGQASAPVAVCLANLGLLYKREGRLRDADLCLHGAVEMRHLISNPEKLGLILEIVGDLQRMQGQFKEAERYLLDARANYAQAFGASDPRVTGIVALGDLYLAQNRLADAEAVFRASLEFNVRTFGPRSWRAADSLSSLGSLYFERQSDQATSYFDQAISIYEELHAPLGLRAENYFLRGLANWKLGQQAAAQKDFDEAMRLGDLRRASITGAAHNQAEAFSTIHQWYTVPGIYFSDSSQIAAALDRFERGRSRLLIDQLSLAHADFLKELPLDKALPLRQRLTEAEASVVKLEQELDGLQRRSDLTPSNSNALQAKLGEDLAIGAYAPRRG